MKALLLIILVLFACSKQRPNPVVSNPSEPPIPERPIEEPPPVEPGKPGFVRFDEIEKESTDDILSLNNDTKSNTRYLLGCNFYNQAQDMAGVKAGISKGINMISTERLIANAVAIDKQECIYRIDIDQLGITTSEWKRIESSNILPFISNSVRGRTLRALTGTNQPVMYASSFFTTVMQADQITLGNGLYYDLTEQPLLDADFLKLRGINLQDEFNREKPACAAGGRSQIALGKPRLICLLESADGFLLVTYDVSLALNDSIQANPFLVEMTKIPGIQSNKAFRFVASEWIYSLPNGLMTGYRLSDARGAQTAAPTNVVLDIEQSGKGFPPDITLGACSNCHHQEGAIFFQDQVADHVRLNAFNATEKKLAEVFYKADRFQARRSVVNQNHARALQQIGVDTLKADPVVTNLIQPLRGELKVEDVAGYLFLEPKDFQEKLSGTALSKVVFGSLLSDGGVVPLVDFVKGYRTLIEELNLFDDDGQL